MISLVRHELRVRRRAILGWTIGLAFFAVMYMGFYPAFPDDLLELDLESIDIYKSMGVESMATFEGYMQSTVFNFLPLLVGAFGIVLGTGALAGEEGDGTLELLAALPISRIKLYTAKAAALIATVLIVLLAVALITVGVFVAFEGEFETSVTALDLFGAMLSNWLIAFIFVSLSLFLGALLPSRGSALWVSVAVLVLAFFGNNLAGMVSELESLQPLSPFSYFVSVTKSILGDTPWDDVLVLFAMGFVPLILGVFSFRRRDLTVGAWPWQRARPSEEAVGDGGGALRSRRVLVPVAALILLACGCLTVGAVALTASDDLRQDVEDRLGIDDVEVATGTGELMVTLAEVETLSAGRVHSVPKSVGDEVVDSDVIVIVADDLWPTLAEEARQVVDAAWVLVAEYSSGVSRPSDTIENLEEDAKQAGIAARASVSALSDATAAEADPSRVEELETRVDLARAQDDIAKARLALAEDRLSIEDVQAVGTAVGKLKPLSSREIDPELYTVHAEATGDIKEVLVVVDEQVAKGQTVAWVSDPESLELLIHFEEEDADRIEVGQKVELEVDDFDDPFDGEVLDVFKLDRSDVDDDDDDKLRWGVLILVDNSSGELEPGLDVEARIELE